MSGLNHLKTLKLKEKLFPYLILLPALILGGTAIIYPMINGIILSFTEYTFINPSYDWIGIKNYIDIFTDPVFGEVFFNSIFIVFISVFLQLVLGLILALLLNTHIPLRGFLRSNVFVIWLIPVIVSALLWMIMFNPEFGIINFVLKSLGIIKDNIYWLSLPWVSKFAIITVFTWKGIPFFMVMILAALQTVPRDLIDAARIDGANNIKVFFHIITPMLKNIIILSCILSIVRLFQDVENVLILTGGGPVYSTTTLALYVYNEAFVNLKMGRAATIGVVWLMFLLIITVIYIRMITKSEQK